MDEPQGPPDDPFEPRRVLYAPPARRPGSGRPNAAQIGQGCVVAPVLVVLAHAGAAVFVVSLLRLTGLRFVPLRFPWVFLVGIQLGVPAASFTWLTRRALRDDNPVLAVCVATSAAVYGTILMLIWALRLP